MKFIWAKTEEKINTQFIFSINIDQECDTLVVCAADTYRVFIDGKFIAFGPERTAKGYSRKKIITLKNAKKVDIAVMGYGVSNYCVDFQQNFFAAELSKNGKVIYDSYNFICYKDLSRLTNMPRYSLQRFFVEGYDYSKSSMKKIDICSVKEPIILDGIGETCSYELLKFSQQQKGIFTGLKRHCKNPWWYKIDEVAPRENEFNVISDFLEKTKKGYRYQNFELSEEYSGFIQIEIDAKVDTEIFVIFEEILIDGVWEFFRSACNDLIVIKATEGKRLFLSCEPYALKYLKIIYKGEANFYPTLIKYENDLKCGVEVDGNPCLKSIFNAAENSFRQNCVDLFTDCPSRERAGYLCDAYFMAKAERFFFGKNDIEKKFLENYLLSNNDELPKNMLPMCFPSQFFDGLYIPNWALWFIVELHDYGKRTGDYQFIEKAKNRVLNVIKYFKDFENELGLLENLEGWIFVEWSISNDPEYTMGINFPSNMLYAYALKCVGEMYGEKSFIETANNLFNQVQRLSFNGEFFVDNAIRVEGEITPCVNHISETCQYYALFVGLCPNQEFADRMRDNFGSQRNEIYNFVGKSNMFIGYYLRLMWLIGIGEKDKVLEDSIKYFSNMAKKTNTLWETNSYEASCCHGFTSVIAPILATCLAGYDENQRDLKVFNGIHYNGKYGVTIRFNYEIN